MVTTRSGKSTTPTRFDNVDHAAIHMAKGMSHETKKQFAVFLNAHTFKHRDRHYSFFSFRGASITVVGWDLSCDYMPIYRSLPAISHQPPNKERWNEFEDTLWELCPNLCKVIQD